jgi:glutamate-5-semialdehyde dehydrogenase
MSDDPTISVQSLGDLTRILEQGRLAASALPFAIRQRVLKALVQALKARQDDILEANTLDLEASLEMAVPDLVIDWLRLTPDRLHNATTALERLQTLDIVATPSGHRRSTLPSGGEAMIQGSWQALGVVALVYEALPELAIFAAGLCLCTGNSLVLKGGNEASQTNQAIAQAFRAALADTDQPEALIQVISASDGEAARRWLMQTPNLDLVIPYGRPSLIQQVCREAYSPVLAPALGNCYLYWAASGDIQTVATAVIASHQGNPDPVNAVEKVLVDVQVSDAAIATLQQQLQAADLQVKVLSSEAVPPTDPELWQQAFLTRTVWLCPVPDVATAIAWINRYSSGHGDTIVTHSYQESRQLIQGLHSATVYVNESPRFLRNPTTASAIALGMAAQRGVFRGRITLDAFLTPKTIVHGG